MCKIPHTGTILGCIIHLQQIEQCMYLWYRLYLHNQNPAHIRTIITYIWLSGRSFPGQAICGQTVHYTGCSSTTGNHEIPQGWLISYRWVFSIRITSFARMFIILKNLLIHHVPVVFCVFGALRHSSTFQVVGTSSLLSSASGEYSKSVELPCP